MNAREEHIAITRTARVSVLGDAQHARELWVVCHGYGQLAHRFIRHFESIAAPERMIAAPEGLHRFYIDQPPTPAPQRRIGATWMTREDRETDIRDYVAYLDTLVEHARADMSAAPRITALGFSQGAATAFRWATLGATEIARLILWGGEVPHDLDMEQARRKLADVQVLVVRGRTDSYASEQTIQAQLRRLEEAGIPASLREFGGAHELNAELLVQIAAEP